MFANVHLLVGYNQGSITDLQSMVTELRKTFAGFKDSEIYAGRVIKSDRFEGFTLVRRDGLIPRDAAYCDWDWEEVESGHMDYYWV